MNITKKMLKKKLAAIGLSLAAASPVLAAGEGTMDTTQAQNLMTAIQNGFTTLLTAAQPIVTTIVLAALGIWVGFFVIRLAKRALKTGS